MNPKGGSMKFARFMHQGNVSYGIVDDPWIRVIDRPFYDEYRETGETVDLSAVKLLPPTVPSKIVCIGLNYIGHIEEAGEKIPEEPLFFFKPPSCLIGNGDPIVYPKTAQKISYEGELAVVVKDRIKDVAEGDALKHILGCAVFNDVTERRYSKKPETLSLAKGFDTFGPYGPFVVTDLDPENLVLKTFLNGSLVQHDNTHNCIFSVSKVISYLTECMTLYPGDVVITGTPKGIVLMQPGDVVEIIIEGIGTLRNEVIHAAAIA